ncbi:MAG: hypothetical protein ACK44C_10425 [Polaromonas sp.]|jgi:uncharacterized integral membrane protein
MRTKILLLVTGIVLLAVFAQLNVEEITRSSTLNLGFTSVQLPLGLLMLMLVVALALIFLVATIYMHSTQLIETRQYARELSAQRVLADQAETSRFTELRSYLQSQTALATNRETDTVTALDRRLVRTERLLLERLEQSDNSNAAYWGQHDDALLRNKSLSNG